MQFLAPTFTAKIRGKDMTTQRSYGKLVGLTTHSTDIVLFNTSLLYHNHTLV